MYRFNGIKQTKTRRYKSETLSTNNLTDGGQYLAKLWPVHNILIRCGSASYHALTVSIVKPQYYYQMALDWAGDPLCEITHQFLVLYVMKMLSNWVSHSHFMSYLETKSASKIIPQFFISFLAIILYFVSLLSHHSLYLAFWL